MFYLTAHATQFIYGYMAWDIWLRSTEMKEETRYHHFIGHLFRLEARDLLYAHTAAFVISVEEHWLEQEKWFNRTTRKTDPTTYHTLNVRSTSHKN